MISTTVSVLTVATPIVGITSGGIATGNTAYPTSCIVRNLSGAGTIYLGGSKVSVASGGWPLLAGEAIELDLVNEGLYAIATVTTTCYVLRRGD